MTSAGIQAAACAGVLLAIGCSGGEQPRTFKAFARSMLHQGTYSASIQVLDPEHALAVVKVTGPGTAQEVELVFQGAAWTAELPLGPTPPVPPLTYDLAINDGRVVVHQGVSISCFLEDLPVPLSPLTGDVVTSPVTYRWEPLLGPGHSYRIYAYPGQRTVVDGSSLTVPTPPGTYDWFIEMYVGTDDACGGRADGGIFTVQ